MRCGTRSTVNLCSSSGSFRVETVVHRLPIIQVGRQRYCLSKVLACPSFQPTRRTYMALYGGRGKERSVPRFALDFLPCPSLYGRGTIFFSHSYEEKGGQVHLNTCRSRVIYCTVDFEVQICAWHSLVNFSKNPFSLSFCLHHVRHPI